MDRQKNYIQQLVEHIKINLNRGYPIDSLKFSLMNQGYSRVSVERAIDIVNKELASTIPLLKEKPQIIYKIINDGEEIRISKKISFWQRVLDFLTN